MSCKKTTLTNIKKIYTNENTIKINIKYNNIQLGHSASFTGQIQYLLTPKNKHTGLLI